MNVERKLKIENFHSKCPSKSINYEPSFKNTHLSEKNIFSVFVLSFVSSLDGYGKIKMYGLIDSTKLLTSVQVYTALLAFLVLATEKRF